MVCNGLYVFTLLHFIGLLLVHSMPCGPLNLKLSKAVL